MFQVDLVAQGDSVYDIIDPTDHFIMRTNLAPPTSPDTGKTVVQNSGTNGLHLFPSDHC